MAYISSYSNSTPIVDTDKWIGTSGADSSTKNFTAGDVKDYIAPQRVLSTIVTNYIYQQSVENGTIVFIGGGNATFTVPKNSDAPFAIGCEILTCNQTGFSVVITPDTGVIVYGTATIASGESKMIKKTDTNTWSIV